MIRYNTDINKIVVHHTGTNLNSTGADHNRDHRVAEEFGSPFDILINEDGKIDLSPQWIYAADSSQYKEDVHFSKLIISDSHYPAAIGKTSEQKKNMVHIALVGNFDTKYPSPYQINGLLKALEFLCRGLKLCVKSSLYYYSEFYLTSSPGIHFPSKANLIDELSSNVSLQNFC